MPKLNKKTLTKRLRHCNFLARFLLVVVVKLPCLKKYRIQIHFLESNAWIYKPYSANALGNILFKYFANLHVN